MSKSKYYYDKKTLSFKKIESNWKSKIKKTIAFTSVSLCIATLMVFLAFKFFDSPKEKILIRELDKMTLQYQILDKDLKQIEAVLDNIKDRDDNIYRVIFEADPIPNSIRKAGMGGINRYESLEGSSRPHPLVRSQRPGISPGVYAAACGADSANSGRN